ncbi:hypothetical protein F4U02_10925 [Acinetobacter haemolyticus]|uniref:Uncharacterized protein n=1 Tax=Acinetobacter haemolyticus ATCC 19194 TaxID=707232 RepID=D4XU06_ACIHA|nr:hypothetical protein [Acinetobacter haemolyticus]EFF81307.1 hypothetical protein HMP0015_3198 [Acinetobacter haemolyticus ATCC 19194]ENW22432.1 hypothetical protein F926_00451 [Acinetobacter haemolyticus NIPH 261]MQZ31497.1 hypothetical protein [Acinetobacter haemolyticus]
MSWDVTVQRFSKIYDSVEDIPDTEACLPIGTGEEVRRAISKYFPSTSWADPAWGVFDSDSGSVEFNCGNDEISTGFMMHIRASEAVVSAIVQMCRGERWQALDCSSGEFLERVPNPENGLNEWKSFRDQVVGDE